MQARDTYTMQDLHKGVVLEPFNGNHAETHETSLSDVGISLGTEWRTILERSLAGRRREARTNRFDWRGRRCLGRRSVGSRTHVEEVDGTTLDRSAEGTGSRSTVALGGREVLRSRKTIGSRETLARGEDRTEWVHTHVLLDEESVNTLAKVTCDES